MFKKVATPDHYYLNEVHDILSMTEEVASTIEEVTAEASAKDARMLQRFYQDICINVKPSSTKNQVSAEDKELANQLLTEFKILGEPLEDDDDGAKKHRFGKDRLKRIFNR